MPGINDIMDTVRLQQKTLAKEVKKHCEERGAAVSASTVSVN